MNLLENINKTFLPAAFWSLEKPYHPDRPDQIYRNELPEMVNNELLFEAKNIHRWRNDVHFIRSISTDLARQYPSLNVQGFDFGAGIYQATVQVQFIPGTWDCIFWLHNQVNNAKPEIDSMEYFVDFKGHAYFLASIHHGEGKLISKRFDIPDQWQHPGSTAFHIEMILDKKNIEFSITPFETWKPLKWRFCTKKRILKELNDAKFDLLMNAGTLKGNVNNHEIICSKMTYDT